MHAHAQTREQYAAPPPLPGLRGWGGDRSFLPGPARPHAPASPDPARPGPEPRAKPGPRAASLAAGTRTAAQAAQSRPEAGPEQRPSWEEATGHGGTKERAPLPARAPGSPPLTPHAPISATRGAEIDQTARARDDGSRAGTLHATAEGLRARAH